MSQEQLTLYLGILARLWPLAGLVVGALLIVLSGARRLSLLQGLGVVITAVSIGVLVARL